MIPGIEEILSMLMLGQIDQQQALAWIERHLETVAETEGMRDHFAALAMQGAFTSPIDSSAEGKEYIAMHAYAMADAMLKARTE